MSQFGLTFHHLGLAVKRPDAALAFLRGLGYEAPAPVFDPLQGVNLILCTHPSEPAVEIIYPGPQAGPVDALVAKHAKGIVYHCCYVSEDVDASLRELESAGLQPFCVAEPKPAVLFGGARVSFHQIVGMGLVEIIEGQPR
jgi:catechol 2,3-dioxygenase-like lactoylglutathione lyase family enzyme